MYTKKLTFAYLFQKEEEGKKKHTLILSAIHNQENIYFFNFVVMGNNEYKLT